VCVCKSIILKRYKNTERNVKRTCLPESVLYGSGMEMTNCLVSYMISLMKKPVSFMTLGLVVCILSFALVSLSAGRDGIAGEKPFLLSSIPEPRVLDFSSADERPAIGKFLVATGRIADPRFRETVILLIDHNGNGTVGLIINRPTAVRLARLLPGIKALQKRPDTAFIGGPVGMEQFFMLIRSTVPPDESVQVLHDAYVSTSRSVLERAVGGAKRGEKFRLYAGYSGWAAGQLERELSRGDWRILQADTGTIFDRDPEKIWQDLSRWNSGIRVERASPSTGFFAAKSR
jgi:putative transcriptional regulator